MSEKSLEKLREIVLKDALAPESLELIEKLSGSESLRAEGRELCFKILKEDGEQHRVRLSLARLFYLDGMTEFCVRELVELNKKVSELSELERLLESFGDLAKPFLSAVAADEEEILIAEMDMDKLVDE